MAKVAKLLGMERTPASTWARHSFATNLNSTGVVPERYISDSMGHSSSGDVTSKYIGAYPLKKMLEYNSYLLNVIDEDDNKEVNAADKKGELFELLKSMSEEGTCSTHGRGCKIAYNLAQSGKKVEIAPAYEDYES